MRNIDRVREVYLGLPDELIGKTLWVKEKFRTNALSLIPGGSDVVVEYHSGLVFGYRWIKYPSSYISRIYSNNSLRQGISREMRTSQLHDLTVLKKMFFRIFARKYNNEDEYLVVPFTEIWNSKFSIVPPWTKLMHFDQGYTLPEVTSNNLSDERNMILFQQRQERRRKARLEALEKATLEENFLVEETILSKEELEAIVDRELERIKELSKSN